MEIKETDLRPLASFPLKWRWTDARWNKLPDVALDCIQPLSEQKASELHNYSLTFLSQYGLADFLFASTVEFAGLIEANEVCVWLRNLVLDATQEVLVSWSESWAVLVNWQVFCDYWDDFCYPASDDVVVLPVTGNWLLFYSHEEYFVFGKMQ